MYYWTTQEQRNPMPSDSKKNTNAPMNTVVALNGRTSDDDYTWAVKDEPGWWINFKGRATPLYICRAYRTLRNAKQALKRYRKRTGA